MDMVEFLKGLFSFSIIIPASIMCYLPMKNQLKFSVKKIALLLAGAFVIIATVSSLITVLFNIRTIKHGDYARYDNRFLLFRYTVKTDFAKTLFVFLSVICLFSTFSLFTYEIESFYKPEMDYGISFSFDLLFMGISLFFMAILAYPMLKYYSWMIDNIKYKKLWYSFMVLPIIVTLLNIYSIPITYLNLRAGNDWHKGVND